MSTQGKPPEDEPEGPGVPPELIDELYDELRSQARRYMQRQPVGHTLQPTALVNEAVIKLYQGRRRDWTSEQHFLAVAATAMLHVLVDYARAKQRKKRKAPGERVPLDAILVHFEDQQVDVIDLQEKLGELEAIDEHGRRGAAIVRLRAFAGFTMEQIAQHLGLSKRTVEREFLFARAWLHEALGLATARD